MQAGWLEQTVSLQESRMHIALWCCMAMHTNEAGRAEPARTALLRLTPHVDMGRAQQASGLTLTAWKICCMTVATTASFGTSRLRESADRGSDFCRNVCSVLAP